MIRILCFVAMVALAGCADTSQNTGTPGSGTSLSNNYSLSLNGIDEYAQRTGTVVSNYPFTLGAWVRTSSLLEQTIIGIARNSVSTRYFRILIEATTGFPSVEARNTTSRKATGTAAVNDGLWHHIVGVFTSATSRQLYVDGVAVASNTTSVTFDASHNVLAIGRNSTSTPGAYFSGSVDEATFWNVALDVNSIAEIYAAGLPQILTSNFGSYTYSANLLSWWRLGDSPGDQPDSGTLVDTQPAAYSLTTVNLANGNLTGDVP